jgi:hypothetical protein
VEDGESEGSNSGSAATIHGRCFVVGDNIDTDQIIPAEYLTLVPSKPEEYQKLGSYAMIGLPAKWGRFIEEGKSKTEYKVVIGGANFGCGSSRYSIVQGAKHFCALQASILRRRKRRKRRRGFCSVEHTCFCSTKL